MKLADIPTALRKFVREIRAFGLLSASRKSVKGIATRSGLASTEQFDVLVSGVQALVDEVSLLRDEVSSLRQEEARLREQINAIQESTSGTTHTLTIESSERKQNEASLREQINGIQEAVASAAAALTALDKQRSSDAAFADAAFADKCELRALTLRLDTDVAGLQSKLVAQSGAIGWLAEHHWTTGPLNPPVAAPIAAPLVSVILPVWNREHLVIQAINSVRQQIYTNWELIIVDDGSTDRSAEAIAGFLEDKRIKYLRMPHQGVSAARNVGLANSRGNLIAYLDSDDLWYPAFLARMVEVFDAAPDRDWAYAAKLLSDASDGTRRILHQAADHTSLLNGNVIPMTAVMHRRSLYEQVGGFDEELVRYVDWDMVLRFMACSEPLIVPVMSGQYRMGSWPRISNQESHLLAYHQVKRKHPTSDSSPLRILYALEFFPQLSETYVTTEIAAMREQGVDVAVWTEHEAPVPYDTDVPVFRGELREAIAQVGPRFVHTHHLYRALRYAPIAQAAGVPMTVRGHGFEFTEERLRELSQTNVIRAVFQFPHFITDHALEGVDASKLRPMTACFNPDLYFPEGTPDRRLVVRTALASPTKHLDAFIRVAAMCPHHRFVLVPCWSVGYPDHLEELLALNRSLGEPVEMLVNRPHAEVAQLVRRAGIYLHTHALQEPYGMPVSIAESMAAGCYVIARGSPAAAAFIAEAGKTYDTEAEAAALVQETETCTGSQWAAARLASVERAFAYYNSLQVLQPLLEEWATAPSESLAATA